MINFEGMSTYLENISRNFAIYLGTFCVEELGRICMRYNVDRVQDVIRNTPYNRLGCQHGRSFGKNKLKTNGIHKS